MPKLEYPDNIYSRNLVKRLIQVRYDILELYKRSPWLQSPQIHKLLPYAPYINKMPLRPRTLELGHIENTL